MSGPDLSVAGPYRAHAAITAEPSSGPFHVRLNFRVEFRFTPEYVPLTLASFCLLPLHRLSFGFHCFARHRRARKGDARVKIGGGEDEEKTTKNSQARSVVGLG
ncbi:hypothetical protein BT93_G0260 [Corymbia citriodora subsp. variegata]|nr:hypothetical protein BT93_G0260 [Corymbia citriodora subsp. variegata]